MNGHALLFNPPPIHKSNFVLFPNYLQYSRLKNFCKALEGKFTTNHDGLVTIMNDLVEFHYNIYNQHLEILELTLEPLSVNDAKRCLDFLKYESYLLQKPIYLSRRPSGLRKTKSRVNSLAHRSTWLRSDLRCWASFVWQIPLSRNRQSRQCRARTQ